MCLPLSFMRVSDSPVVVCRRRRLSLSSLFVSVSDLLHQILLVLPSLFFLLGSSFRGNSGENFLHRVGENQGFTSCLQFRLLFVFVANKIMTHIVFTERDHHIYDGGLNLRPPTSSKSETQLWTQKTYLNSCACAEQHYKHDNHNQLNDSKPEMTNLDQKQNDDIEPYKTWAEIHCTIEKTTPVWAWQQIVQWRGCTVRWKNDSCAGLATNRTADKVHCTMKKRFLCEPGNKSYSRGVFL